MPPAVAEAVAYAFNRLGSGRWTSPVPDGGETSGLEFVGAGEDASRAFTDIVEQLRHRWRGRWPLAEDAGGNWFLLTDAGAVEFWDHDTARLHPAAPDIATFLAAIVPDEIPARGPEWAWLDEAVTAPLAELQSWEARRYPAVLKIAIEHDRVDVIDWLLPRAGLATDVLYWNAACGSASIVQWLVDRGVPPQPAIGAPFSYHRADTLDILVRAGADPWTEWRGGSRPPGWSRRVRAKMFALLAARLHQLGDGPAPPLSFARALRPPKPDDPWRVSSLSYDSKLPRRVGALDRRGMLAVVRAETDPAKLLSHFAFHGDDQTVQALLAAGFDPNTGPPDWRPLHSAAVEGHALVAAVLLGAGADPGARHPDGVTAAHAALARGHRGLAWWLLSRMR